MDGFDHSTAPQAYLDIEWIPNTFAALMGIGWFINYVGMVRNSFRDHTYNMPIISLCSNFAWETVYSVIYPPKGISERLVFSILLFVNLGIMYAAIKFSPQEWSHAPLVQKNLPLIFAIGIFAFFTGQLAFAAEIGPSLAYNWGGMLCQVMLSVGSLTQLVSRGSTRGGSYTLWQVQHYNPWLASQSVLTLNRLARSLGSCSAIVMVTYRYLYWPEVFSGVFSPFSNWCMSAFVLSDLAYGICFYNIRQKEIEAEKSKRN